MTSACDCDGKLESNCARCGAAAELPWCLEHDEAPPLCPTCAAEENS